MPSTRTICTLQYNPYSNREKKGYTLYTGYAPYVVGTFTGINFNPADGVNTELILNTVSDKADYCLVMDGNTIESRWFILDCNRTRGGQYQLQLYRDVVYDNLPEVMSATAFIEKGWINDVSNPLIFNQETLPTNQRKIDERLIKDRTNTPWIVGYLPKKSNLTEELCDIEVTQNAPVYVELTQAQFNILNSGHAYNKRTLLGLSGQGKSYYYGEHPEHLAPSYYYKQQYDYSRSRLIDSEIGKSETIPSDIHIALQPQIGDYPIYPNLKRFIVNCMAETFEHYYDSIQSSVLSQLDNDIALVQDLNNKYVSYNGTIYKVSFDQDLTSKINFLSSSVSGFNSYLYQKLTSDGTYSRLISTSDVTQTIIATPIKTNITLTAIPQLTAYHLTIPNDSVRLQLDTESNYTMFCMPWNDYRFTKSDSTVVTLSGQISRLVAQAISKTLSGSGILLDLQLLPYCPLQDYLSTSGLSIMQSKLIPNQLTPIYEGSTGTTISSYIFWCTTAQINIQREYSWFLKGSPEQTKVEAQTLSHRICAPDKSAIFEYSPYKVISLYNRLDFRADLSYNIYCNYKPYKPFVYVEVQSDGDSLYGPSFTDGRGLICSGDFSLPQTSDAWETYQIQNKNYANVFNRQIQSIELQNKYAKVSDVTNAVTGTLGAITSGIASGFAVSGGNPVGAVIGGIASGIASAGAGATDVAINETLRKDQLDLKKDLYQYNLENIQALPNTLLNVGALTDVNKLYPYIEVYDCTEVEKQALRNKIKYNGMSIGVISEGLNNYIISDTSDRSFIKGQIIKIDLHDDYHMLKNIRQEFETGFFINRGGN